MSEGYKRRSWGGIINGSMADAPFEHPRLVPLLGVGPMAAIVVVVLFSIAGGMHFTEGLRSYVGLGLGTLYLGLSTVGMGWALKRAQPRPVYRLLAALSALCLVTMAVFKGSGAYMSLPVLSMVLLYCSHRWALAQVGAVVGAQSALLAAQGYEWKLVSLGAVGYVSFAVFVFVFTRMAMNEQRAKHEAQRSAAQVAELAAEKERTRIARELHDSIGHALTALHMQIAAARALIGTDSAAAIECLDRARELAHEGLREARRAVTMLRSEPLGGRPFAVALDELIEGQSGEPTISLNVSGTPRALAAATEFVLYRAAQEALTNVRRHAQATRAEIRLHYGESSVTLKVEDDGKGTGSPEGGHGLIGLRERVQTVGGAVSVRTAQGQGFALDVEVPT